MSPPAVHMEWKDVEGRPSRIQRVETELRWPGLPEERVQMAWRVANLCPIHATLRGAAEVGRRITAPSAREGA